MTHSFIPNDWKIANVTPVHKKGDKTLAGNYRPISLTSIVGKIMETIITHAIRDHLEKNNLILPSQHGFRSKRSCLTNLLEFFHEVVLDYDNCGAVDIIYLDFQKAFDSVPHQRLITKVRALGINGQIAAWIENWLSGRKQRVVINGQSSDWIDVTSGVPQGSVLGPLLFVIYINDLDCGLVNRIVKFADDAKLGGRVDSQRSFQNLQDDLNTLSRWANTWQMSFNANKCKVMHIGNSNPLNKYYMNDVQLSQSNSEKDLGVLVNRDLKDTSHCVYIENKCNRLLGLIKRKFKFKNRKIIMTLFNYLILPHLQYCVQFWSPALSKDVTRLEKIQARATKLIPEIRHLPYEDRLKNLGIRSLANRRIILDLVQTYKILHGVDNVEYSNYFTLNENCTRNNGLKLSVLSHNTNILGNFYTRRVVKYWNKLPETVVSSENINTFKSRLDRVIDKIIADFK